MQSISPSFTTPIRSPMRVRAAISRGSRPQGQARTQLTQRMQGMASRRVVSFSVKASRALLPLTVGMRVLGRGWPIIGPPLMSLAGLPVNPPQ